MPKLLSNIGFRGMCFIFKIIKRKDKIQKILKEANINSGDIILDYGCGPGNYSIPAAQIVGDKGKVFATDMHPLSAQFVLKNARKANITTLENILTSCKTGLNENSVDVVLLFDVFHYFKDINPIFSELSRVLKPSGTIALEIHHVDKIKAINSIIETNLFNVKEKKEHMFILQKTSK
ncbi:MAG: class I SAM-dependent methyltransferase [Promethearchaeota archaeon]